MVWCVMKWSDEMWCSGGGVLQVEWCHMMWWISVHEVVLIGVE